MSAPEVRPRYGRIAMLATSMVVTATAVLGGAGVLPSGGSPSYAATASPERAELSAAEPNDATVEPDPAEVTEEAGAAAPVESSPVDSTALPADSGEGRRVVFDEGAQRVWLVERGDEVARTYLVSGSVYDNLDPGTYAVFSRSEEAWGIDGSELRWMVRFTTGSEAAIGFHNIPVLDGEKVQTRDELGTPLSHGCIRQWGQDAKALWEFAPVGTTVVVVDTSVPSTDRSEDG
jgi:hypothetical protein